MATLYIPIDKINNNLILKSKTSFSDILSILYRIYYYNKINFKKSVNNNIIKYDDLMKDKFKNCMYGGQCGYNRQNNCNFLHPNNYELRDEHDFDTSFNVLSKKKEFINYTDNNFNIEIFTIENYFNKYSETYYDDKVDLHNKIFCIDEYLDYKNFFYCEKQLYSKNGLIVRITFKKKHREYTDNIYENIDYFYYQIIRPIYDQINMIDEDNTFINYFVEYKELEFEKEKKMNELIIYHSKQKKIELAYKNKILILCNWIRVYQLSQAINIDHLDKDVFYKKFKFVKSTQLDFDYISLEDIKQLISTNKIPVITWNDVPNKYKNYRVNKLFQRSLIFVNSNN